MAAHVGINNQSTYASTLYGINTPSGGYTNEATKEDAVELATVRDESGVTKVCKPKNLKTTTTTIRGKGDAALSGVSAGSFSSGTVKFTQVTPAIGSGEDEILQIDFPEMGLKFDTDLYVFFNQATKVNVIYG